LAAALVALAHTATAGTDCPLAFQPYSSSTVLMDLLINPSTKAILEKSLPSAMLKGTPPSITAVIAPRELAQMGMVSESILPALDAQLAAVRVTQQDTEARCARYDETRPRLPSKLKPPAILVFTKINGFRDDLSVNAATAALKAMGARRGWALVFIDNGAVFNPDDLKHFKAVIWNNVSGDALTLTQQKAFRTYIERGGGFAGIHGSGGDPHYVWDWYADTLIGARFLSHPMAPQFQAAKVMIDAASDAIVQGLSNWTMTEEWYSFKSNPRSRGAHILATLDESTYSPVSGSMDLRMGDHPIAWTQCIGDGRSFYTAIGHRPESYTDANAMKLLERGVAWAAGLGETQCPAGREYSTGK
jgi:type 1 glutamine amidotransferase